MRKDCCRGHMTLPLPGIGLPIQPFQVMLTSLTYGQDYFLGVTPIFVPPYTYLIHRAWAVFETAESGADGSNNTGVSFQMGDDLASLTEFANLTTSGNPAAGEPVIAYLNTQPEMGKLLVVTASVNGEGSAVLSGAGFAFGVDLLPVRAA